MFLLVSKILFGYMVSCLFEYYIWLHTLNINNINQAQFLQFKLHIYLFINNFLLLICGHFAYIFTFGFSFSPPCFALSAAFCIYRRTRVDYGVPFIQCVFTWTFYWFVLCENVNVWLTVTNVWFVWAPTLLRIRKLMNYFPFLFTWQPSC